MVIELLLYLFFINIAFGVFILQRNIKSKQNIAFSAIMFGSALWVLGFYLLQVTNQFYWPDKITHFGGIMLVAGFYAFSLVFPRELRNVSWGKIFLELSGLLVVLAILPFNTIIQNIDFSGGRVNPVNGPMFPILMIVEFGYAYLTIRNIYLQFNRNSGINRERILYVLLGLALLMGIGMVSEILLPALHITYFQMAGAYSSLFFAVLSSVSIVSLKLMDVRLLTKNILINLLSAIGVVGVSLMFFSLHLKLGHPTVSLFLLVLFIPILIFWSIRTILNSLTKRFFLRNYYRSQNLLNELNIKLNQELDPEKIILITKEYLLHALQLKWAEFKNLKKEDKKNLELIDFLASTKRPYYTHSNIDSELFADYPSLPIAVLPLFSDEKFAGYFVLGPENGITGLSAEKIQKINATWSHLQTAYSRAELYEGLEQKVKAQVKDLTYKNKQLNEVMKTRVEFLQMISHQLKSPITSLSGALELLNRGGLGPEDSKEMLTLAYEKSRDLSESFTGILNLAKVQKGGSEVEIKSAVELADVFQNILKVLVPQAETKGIKVENYLPDSIRVYGNKIYLEQAFFNVIENAITHSGGGSVKIQYHDEENFAVVSISDTGKGIPSDMRDKVFKKHARGKESRGSGIGLYIVQSIVKAHPKGHVWFETGSSGTTFHIRLLKSRENMT